MLLELSCFMPTLKELDSTEKAVVGLDVSYSTY